MHYKGRDWYCYPSRLPGGKEGPIKLFMSTVTLGDGVTRDTLARCCSAVRAASGTVSTSAVMRGAAPSTDSKQQGCNKNDL